MQTSLKKAISGNHLRLVKTGLSLFLLYHLSTILLLPVGSSIVGRKLSRYFTSYANTFGFNTTWQFFSPGPSPMFYLEYELEKPGDTDSIASSPLTYPSLREGLSWSDGWNRRLFGMRYFSLNGDLLERFFVPYLCRQNPGTQAISVKRVFEQVEDIEHAGAWAEFQNLTERFDLQRQRISCPPSEGG